MITLLLAAAPILFILSLSGFGAALKALPLVKCPRREAMDIFDAAFFGMFFISGGVLVANFVTGIGRNPGALVLTMGVVLFAILQWRSIFSWHQLPLLMATVMIVSFLVGPLTLGYDSGLYHIPSMNWVAMEPTPFGLANLEGRLGLNSGWLLLQSAFRFASLQWSHLGVAEIAIRVLVTAWAAKRLFTAIAHARRSVSLVYFAGFVVLLVLIFPSLAADEGRIVRNTWASTDTSANLLALCTWLVFCNLTLMAATELRVASQQEFTLLFILAALAITFKLSLLPIILLPLSVMVLLLRYDVPILPILKLICAGAAASAIYGALWLTRNFMLSGCVVFPVALTCTSVPWVAVGPHSDAKFVAASITGWARHPGPKYADYTDFANMTWLPEWFSAFSHSVEFIVLMTAATFAVGARFLLPRQKRLYPDDNRAPYLIFISTICTATGLSFWFLTAPDVRFSSALFLILAATCIFHGLRHLNYAPPTIRVAPTAAWCVVGSFTLAIVALGVRIYPAPTLLTSPTPPSTIVHVPIDWQFYRPKTGEDQCWDLFPCSPYDFVGKSVERWHGRYFFRATGVPSQ
jgi:hypothetical protein